MRIGLVVAGLLVSSAAMAQGNAAATRKAQEEAKHFLRPCLMDEGEENRLCETNRALFARNYQGAMAGDYQSQRNVSAFLEDRGIPQRDFRIGVEPNVLQSCAWALVTLNSGHARANEFDVRYVRSRCGHRDVDRRAAELRAEAIMAEIRRSPAQMPVEPRVQRQPGPPITTSLPEDK
jgi:hypothetical protein